MNHCQHCSRDFATPSSLKRHINAKHKGNSWTLARHEHQCSRCDAHFARKETLQRHFGSKHNRQSMEQCQFCSESFRNDYLSQHICRCARRYWAKVCKNANLISCYQDDQSNGNNTAMVRLDTSSIVQLSHGTKNSFRVVHEIIIDMRLALMAFRLVYLHCYQSRDVESCLEAITASFRMGLPIEFYLQIPFYHPFHGLSRLANGVGRYIRGDLDINDNDYYIGYTLLEHACRTGASSLLEPLVWKGANFTRKSLVYAVESGSLDTVRFCLALGADPNDSIESEDESNPLIIACARPETAHIASLLIEYGATVFVRAASGETPLHFAANRGDISLLRVLLAKESSTEFLDATDEEGLCAMTAAIRGQPPGTPEGAVVEFVSILLDAGADAKAGDKYNDSVLLVAAEQGCEAIVRLLLEREPESPQKTAWLLEAFRLATQTYDEITIQTSNEAMAGARINLVGYEI